MAVDDLLQRLTIRPLFRDRRDAGAKLAETLNAYRNVDALVLGIPRGGVPVAAEVARRLGAELDVVVARKLGAPSQPELAIGAVTANGGRFLDQETIVALDVSDAYLQQAIAREMEESRRREQRFRAGRPPARITGRTVIVVDDGLATGATMRAALHSVRLRQPAHLVAAVPVGARQSCEALRLARELVDAVICPHERDLFIAVGCYYRNFAPTEDEEVQQILEEFDRGRGTAERECGCEASEQPAGPTVVASPSSSDRSPTAMAGGSR